jgi:hypothetical protein
MKEHPWACLPASCARGLELVVFSDKNVVLRSKAAVKLQNIIGGTPLFLYNIGVTI